MRASLGVENQDVDNPTCPVVLGDLPAALRNRELRVAYQPIVSLDDTRIVAAEALLRWNHPSLGAVSPDAFLPSATDASLMGEITRYVLGEVCSQLASWQRQGKVGPKFRVALNIASDDLVDLGLAETIKGALDDANVDAGCLVVEVTERDLVRDTSVAREVLLGVRRLGVRIALDDFGTGFSSLSYLKHFPVDTVKIDRSFVAGLGDDADSTALVRALMALTRTLGLLVVAEGIENDTQLDVLRQLGCDLGQGYLWSPAVPEQEFIALVAAESPASMRGGSSATRPVPQVTGHLSWAVIDSLPTEIAVLDATGEIVATNLAWQRFALRHGGDTATCGVGVNYLAVCDRCSGPGAEDAAVAARGVRAVLSGELKFFDFEYDFPGTRSSVRFVLHVSALPTAGGAVVAHLDITERHAAKVALTESETRVREIFDQLPVGIIRVDSDDRIVEVNPEFCRIVGVSAGDLYGSPRSPIFELDPYPGGAGEPPSEASAAEESVLRRIRRPDGSLRMARVRDVLVADQDGHCRVVLATVADVTDQVRLNEDLRRSQEMEALGRLAAGIAHEINTPTQFISDNLAFLTDMWEGLSRLVDTSRMAVQRLRQGCAPEEIAVMLETVIADGDLGYAQSEIPTALSQSQEGTRRVARIVKAMKAFGHPDQDHPERTDVKQMVLDTLTVAGNELKYSADVSTDFADMPTVSCYRGAMSQVILNLLVNASDAIQERAERGLITIRTSFDGTFAQIDVTDDGPGIPPEVLPKIFRPFFTTKPVGRGTGQGLALAWSTVVERHKGSIDVCSSPSGTTFTVRIPANIDCHSPATQQAIQAAISAPAHG